MRKKCTILLLSPLILLSVKGNIQTGKISPSFYATALLSPTELLSFSAAVKNDSIVIEWSGFWENGNKHFEIERSTNGRSWEVIGFVKDESNNSFQRSYMHADAEPVRGQSYYRLKQVNHEGIGKYSKTIAVYYPGVSSPKTIASKDSGNTFLIKNRTLSNRSMTLFNAIGHRVIFDYDHTDDGTQINLKQMPEGIYTLRINRGIATPAIVTLVKN